MHDDVTILSCTSSSRHSHRAAHSNGLDEGMIDKSCAILNEISIIVSTSLSNTNTNTKTKRRRFKNDDEDQEEARVSEGVVG